jgi:DUF4097 and DUF4098 domain-containing protein YvlB
MARTRLARLAVGLLILGGCDDQITEPNFETASEPFSLGVALSTQTRLRVEAINGTVVVNGGSQSDSLSVVGVRQVGSRTSLEDAEMRLAGLQVDLQVQGDDVVVATLQPADTEGRNYIVDYEVTLPRSFQVVITSANGTIRVASIQSTVTVAHANGQIDLADIVGSVDAGLANGEIVAGVTLPLDGTINLQIANGDIELSIPTTTSAQFSASVGNGDIVVSGVELRDPVRTSSSLTGTLGSGRGVITLGAGNGTITLRSSG